MWTRGWISGQPWSKWTVNISSATLKSTTLIKPPVRTAGAMLFKRADVARSARYRLRIELARVGPDVAAQAPVVRVEADLVHLFERLLDAPMIARDAIDGAHFARAMQTVI